MAGQAESKRMVATISANLESKADFIRSYFRHRQQDLERAKKLLHTGEHYVDGWLLLSCLVGSLASLRYALPVDKHDGLKYKAIVLKYSGDPLWRLVDVLFLLQWDRSRYASHNRYRKNGKYYRRMKKVLSAQYGDENSIRSDDNRRYISSPKLVNTLVAHWPGHPPKSELATMLEPFSLVEMLYRYVRNHAVHEMTFPFVTEVMTTEGVEYRDNHRITSKLLCGTVAKILHNLEAECMAVSKFPSQLPQKRRWI